MAFRSIQNKILKKCLTSIKRKIVQGVYLMNNVHFTHMKGNPSVLSIPIDVHLGCTDVTPERQSTLLDK